MEWFFRRDVQVVTVTDKTPEGRLLREPTKAKPVYYEMLLLGYTDYGRSTAGVRPPEKKAMLKLIMKLLADQGYYPANSKQNHKPELLLAVGWGTMDSKPGMALQFMGGDKLGVMSELLPMKFDVSYALRRQMRSSLADFVVDCSNGSLYVISIQAFDETAALAGETKLLWHTKVSCPSNGLDIMTTLPQMAREAGPLFGKETAKPVKTTAPLREGYVNMGELKTLERIDPDRLPVTDMDEGPDALGPDAQKRKK